MFSLQRFFILLMTVIIVSTAAAQGREMTVEESYLQEAIEVMIIREFARSPTREQKLFALRHINEVVERDRGNTNDEIRQTLEFLALEGRRSVVRENGRVVNNFPDVRRQAAIYLGRIGTEEARRTLIEILQYENEPMVLQEAIKSLGEIETTDFAAVNEIIFNISWVMSSSVNSYHSDNLMALATIDAFSNIARRNGGLNSPEAIRTLISISEGNYLTPVRERARQMLAQLRRM